MNRGGYDDLDWLGLNWSKWISLNPEEGVLATLPTDPGLYRVRHRDRDGLTYIGETGRSVRGRVRALARGAFADEMPYRDPHVAAPCLWAIRQEDGPVFEASVAAPSEAADNAQRKSIEAALFACYRREMGESPPAAFSRIIPGYELSSYRSDGHRGGPLSSGEQEPHTDPGIPPLEWVASEDPLSDNWMGLEWSDPEPLQEIWSGVPDSDGLYRIWERDAGPPLEYIGESANVRSRLRTHRRSHGDGVMVSYAAPAFLEARHERLEAETDLLGVHHLAVGKPPKDQF